MTLLREIQDSTTNPSFKVSDVLRKCKILAARLDHQAFKEWVEWELNGYKAIGDVPEYRILRGVPSYGDFFGLGGSGVRNAPIPMLAISEEFREPISTIHFYQGIEALDTLVKNAEGVTVRMPWLADAVTFLRPQVYEYMHCAIAWRMVPVNAIAAIADTVKTRILDFVLEIEAQAPEAGEASPGLQPIPEPVINYIFNKCVLHGITTQNQGGVMLEDHSTTTNIHAGRDASGNVVGSKISGVVAGGDISGTVSIAIDQLRSIETPEAQQLVDRLVQLRAVIEHEPNLEAEDKTTALEQVKILAEAGQNSKDGAIQRTAKGAIRMLKGLATELPTATKLVEGLNSLLPAIAHLLGL